MCSVLEVLIAYFDAVWLMYQALPFIKTKNLYADYFAGLPITYYNFVKVCIIFFFSYEDNVVIVEKMESAILQMFVLMWERADSSIFIWVFESCYFLCLSKVR